jgi:hypothetical protein
MKTGWLSQWPVSDEPPRPDYPDLTATEREVCDVFAAGLFLSKSSCQWAYFNARAGNADAFKSIIRILHGAPVRLTRA